MNYQKETLKEQSYLHITIKTTKYLGINLIKVRDLYTEDYKTLSNETVDTNKWKYIPCSSTEGINIIKRFILSKAVYRFNAIFIKIPRNIFHRNKTKILKFIQDHKRL